MGHGQVEDDIRMGIRVVRAGPGWKMVGQIEGIASEGGVM